MLYRPRSWSRHYRGAGKDNKPKELLLKLPDVIAKRKLEWKNALKAHVRLCADDVDRADEADRVRAYKKRPGGGQDRRVRRRYDAKMETMQADRAWWDDRGYKFVVDGIDARIEQVTGKLHATLARRREVE